MKLQPQPNRIKLSPSLVEHAELGFEDGQAYLALSKAFEEQAQRGTNLIVVVEDDFQKQPPSAPTANPPAAQKPAQPQHPTSKHQGPSA